MDQNKSSNLALFDGLKPLWQNQEIMSDLMKKTVKAKELKYVLFYLAKNVFIEINIHPNN